MENILTITAINNYEIYKCIEWLKKCLIKKITRGIIPDVNHLSECSTMKKIIRDSKKLHINFGGCVFWDRNYEREARAELAKIIIDEINE